VSATCRAAAFRRKCHSRLGASWEARPRRDGELLPVILFLSADAMCYASLSLSCILYVCMVFMIRSFVSGYFLGFSTSYACGVLYWFFCRRYCIDLESSGCAMEEELLAVPLADEPPPPSCACMGMRGLGGSAKIGKTRGGAAIGSSADWGGRGESATASVERRAVLQAASPWVSSPFLCQSMVPPMPMSF
jgi:hypothetical protein